MNFDKKCLMIEKNLQKVNKFSEEIITVCKNYSSFFENGSLHFYQDYCRKKNLDKEEKELDNMIKEFDVFNYFRHFSKMVSIAFEESFIILNIISYSYVQDDYHGTLYTCHEVEIPKRFFNNDCIKKFNMYKEKLIERIKEVRKEIENSRNLELYRNLKKQFEGLND